MKDLRYVQMIDYLLDFNRFNPLAQQQVAAPEPNLHHFLDFLHFGSIFD